MEGSKSKSKTDPEGGQTDSAASHAHHAARVSGRRQNEGTGTGADHGVSQHACCRPVPGWVVTHVGYVMPDRRPACSSL